MKNYAASRFAPRGRLEPPRKNLKLVVLDARGGWKRVGFLNATGERELTLSAWRRERGKARGWRRSTLSGRGFLSERGASKPGGGGSGAACVRGFLDLRTVARFAGGMRSVVGPAAGDWDVGGAFNFAFLGSGILFSGHRFQLSALHGDGLPRISHARDI